MSPAPCDSIREALPWFVGCELEPEHMASVRAHLVGCVACRGEASALHQGVARLQRASTAPVPGIDDAFFADLHRSIVARVETIDAAPVVARGSGLRGWLAMAAVLLVGFGFWLGRGGESSIFDRPPLTTPAAFDTPATVVPWVGPRVTLRPLGNETAADEPGADLDGQRAGMMARDRLRDLVDEKMVLPRRQVSPR
jgi:hypothetical protein